MNLPGKISAPPVGPASARRAPSLLLVVVCAATMTACGDGFKESVSDKRTQAEGPSGTPAGTGGTPGNVAPGQDVPVDTFLASSAVPSRVKTGPEMILRFRSNIGHAAFQCATSSDTWSGCPEGDKYVFRSLVHGKGYQLKVRAVTGDGRIDASPLILSFVVDNLNGLSPHNGETQNPSTSGGDTVLLPVSPSELPLPIDPVQSGGAGQSSNRTLQVGTDLALKVPPAFLVTSYATTKTYNNSLHLMRIMGADTGTSLFPEEPCDRSFERIVAGPLGYSYCDATPTRAEWNGGYAARIPHNHVEIVRLTGTRAEEKFFISAFDAEADPSENAIGIQTLCSNSISSGQSQGPLAEGFFEGQTVHGVISWCQTRDRFGRWWWLGSADLDTTSGQGGPRIRAKLIYTLAHQPAVYSGQRFATLFSEQATRLLSKLSQ